MWRLLFFPIFAVAFFLVAFLFYYSGGYAYNPPPAPDIAFEELRTFTANPVDFTDQPVFIGNSLDASFRGTLLVDQGHRNAYAQVEISALLSRVADRGYAVEFWAGDETVPSDSLEEKLRTADAFLVISPQEPYAPQEVDLVTNFVLRGGKLLLIADPGRQHRLNSLSKDLGISFQPDYLYNLSEYDSNFQEVFFRDFQAHAITSGIDELILYYAGSIKSTGPGLAFTDSNTHSSIADRMAIRSPLAIGAHRNVLAAHDLTFMIPPYNAVGDNDRLVANFADFLTEKERGYRLSDFPHFFEGSGADGKASVDILLGQPYLFDLGAGMRQLLNDGGIVAEVARQEDSSLDLVFLGLYADAPTVYRYLGSLGISLDDTLNAPFVANLSLERTAVIALHQAGDRNVLIILSDTPDGLAHVVDKLGSGDFRSGLVDDFAGIYQVAGVNGGALD